MTERPNWDQTWYDIAEVMSRRSTCPRASIGVVIVSEDNRPLVMGYNGAPEGEDHCVDVGCAMLDGHCTRATHAEANAVGYAARRGISLKGSRLYLTGPRDICHTCQKLLKSAGVEYEPKGTDRRRDRVALSSMVRRSLRRWFHYGK